MNIGAFLSKTARLSPERVAVTNGHTQLTYRELDVHAAAFADGLRRRGYKVGDRVVIFCGNRIEYVTVLFGLFKGGYVAVPVNAKLHPAELAFILEHCDARAVIGDGKTRRTIEQALGTGRRIEFVDIDKPGHDSLNEIIAGGDPADFVDVDVDPEDLAWIFYTSGTTGTPKGAMLTHRNLCACSISALADMCDFTSDDVVLHVAPLSHGSGLYLLPSIARGAKHVVREAPSFDPSDVLALIAEERVTVIAFLAPTMIHMLLDAHDAPGPSSLRRVIYGGAPIDPSLAQAAIDRFGRIFVQLYGQGESPMTITYLRAEDHLPQFAGSAGVPRTDVDVRLVDEHGRPVADGQEGEVCVRGDVVMRGYWNDPDATARALGTGWLVTGDVGRFDDGYLYLVARRKEVIISGGTNIYPREVEEALLRHPAVREACAFGVPDPKWGESVVVAVVASSPTTEAELIDHCRHHIASFKKPKRIEFRTELPTNAYGKVLRRELQAGFVASTNPTDPSGRERDADRGRDETSAAPRVGIIDE